MLVDLRMIFEALNFTVETTIDNRQYMAVVTWTSLFKQSVFLLN